MSETLPVRKTESIFNTVENIRNKITRRAYEIFEGNGSVFGNELDHWLSAERELLWQPPLELREKDHEFLLKMAVAGLNPKDIQIEATAEHLVLTAEIHHEHAEEKGKVHTCEFEQGSLFRVVHFPKKVDPSKMKAEFKDGMLQIKAPITEARDQRASTAEAA